MELNLWFPEVARVIVSFDGDTTDTLEFVSPITQADRDDIRWYLETYAASYATDVDDRRATQIAQKLPQWGEALFDAVFRHRAAQRLCDDFLDEDEPGKLLTIAARHPEILALPWELLRDSEGTYLLHDNPRISIRRKLGETDEGRESYQVKAKERLRLLYVVSRPSDAGFIDPRAESRGVLEAIECEAAGRVEVEFLRPATFRNLVTRLEDKQKPPIDILHFDGHGVFNRKEQVGYLLFTRQGSWTQHQVSAELLGKHLSAANVPLVLLSACQSAAVGDGEDAIGTVAVGLNHAGIPTVVSMTYSVLVEMARSLFSTLYQNLSRGQDVGTALDNAREFLLQNPDRGLRQRGKHQIPLKLYDWFLPALYQTEENTPLLTPQPLATSSPSEDTKPKWGNFPPPQKTGFFGRSWELWDIEQAFVRGKRCVTLSGFGGQGKTELALEAGRWLCRTGMFRRACFVDFYRYQGADPVGYAVSTLATVVEESLIDAEAATAVLHREPTLLILDNLEILEAEPLRALLDVAKNWSEAGNSRVLLTTRAANFHHPDYPTEGSYRHLAMPLAGLGRTDALAYFQSLMQLPPAPKFDLPKREALLNLFELVGFHPLSIKLLARELKDRRIAEVGEKLEGLLADTSVGDKDRSLVASLNLSLERLDAQSRQWLPRLGVFQGGAWEIMLLSVTQFEKAQWQILREGLEATGLIQVEPLLDVNFPYIKFHPTLAPTLWKQLSVEQWNALQQRHRQHYYQVSRYLYQQDDKHPHAVRAMTQRELPNLMFAVRGALVVEDADAVDFVEKVNRFLYVFRLQSDRAQLTQLAAELGGDVGSQIWFLAQSSSGEQLFSVGRCEEAARVFAEILAGLGETPSYNRCLTLTRLGRCLRNRGMPAEAATLCRRGLAELDRLDPSDGVKRQQGVTLTDLADVLMQMGEYDGARQAYEASLEMKRELGDTRGEAVVQLQLGTLALVQNNLAEAERRYQAALKTFGQLNEPARKAQVWHNLGIVYQEARQWEAAEEACRQAAQIDESLGNLQGAATTWNQLARVNALIGKPEAAEAWYRKAIAVFQEEKEGDRISESKVLNNLANLLQTQPHQLPEARQLAEDALAIQETLDPAAAEIWKTYNILAQIAQKQNEPDTARHYRRLSREARMAFAGTQYELRRHASLIAGVVAAVEDTSVRQQLEVVLDGADDFQKNLVAAIRQIWAGERDEAVLCDPLTGIEAPIIRAILCGIADPVWLAGWTTNIRRDL
ncbi:MAG: tetratricopeptide repeat protein [Cyanobacteriota bacterium]|nr:tetratricopeptide repeat protein [Cyanobacteriota bacterium]